MPFFSKEKHDVVICSPMEGVITYKDKPVSGAKVERWLKWKDEKGEKDYVITDNNGKFSLPIVEDTVSLSPVSQFVMAQEIQVYFKDKKVPIWAKAKHGKGLYDELGGEPKGFSCELTDEFKKVDVDNGMLITSCTWKIIE